MRRAIGHIRERGKDTFLLKISLGKDSSGTYQYQYLTVHGGRKDAELRLSEITTQIEQGTYAKPTRTTVADFLKRFLSDYVRVNLSPKGYERYESVCRVHLTKHIGNITLAQLKPSHVQAMYTALVDAGLAPRSVRYVHIVLHKALVTAIKWGLLARNVCDGVDVPRARRTEMQVWTGDEMAAFLETARGSHWYPLFHAALFTGMRRSELLALRWQDIDFIYSQISVSRTLHHVNGKYIYGETKSSRSRRTIAMSPALYGVMEAYRHARDIEASMIDETVKEMDLVFCDIDTGRPYRPNTVSRAWSLMVHKAGVKSIRFHDARHTHASLLLRQGIHPKIVQERLGHSSIAITLDTYSHVAPGLQEAAALKFDEAVAVRHNIEVKSES